MLNLKEKEVLAQLYANEADPIKYLPFFFNNSKDLQNFIDIFGGKNLRIPTSYQEYLENYLKKDTFTSNKKLRGINCIRKYKSKIIESYISLFTSLREVLENECKGSD